jgi:hypothetical protein
VERQVHWLAFLFVPVGWLTAPLAAPVAGKELAVSQAFVAMAAAEVAAVAGRATGTTTPSKGRWTRQEETVPTGSDARRSSGTSRIPCGRAANNPDEGAVCPRSMRRLARLSLTKKKRKVLDIANKRRNTAACFEVGYVSSSFLHGADDWCPAPPR